MEKEEKKDKIIETPVLDSVRVLKSAIYCQVGPVERLRYIKDDDGVIHYVSDVNLLMNAERLRNQIGEESYLNLIRGIQPKKSPYDNKYTDEQLFTAIKSRFIQTPSEVLAWIESLGSAGDSIRSELDALTESIQTNQQSEATGDSGKAAE
jgi:hypothetical protein